jgi:phosphonate transport system substrate-binding protein
MRKEAPPCIRDGIFLWDWMNRRRLHLLLFWILAVILFTSAGYGGASPKRVTLAVLPCSDVVLNFKKFHPFVRYLEEQTGLKIDLIVPKDDQEFGWTIKNREIDFVFQDPHTYVSFAGLYKKNALIRAVTKDGKPYQYGLIIVRKDSGLKGIRSLKGRTVMFGPKLSAAKWIAAKEVFKENGIDIDKDLKAYQNGGCCEDIVFNVYLKAVDAGVVCEHFMEGHPEKQKELGIKVKDLAVIGKTVQVPTRIFTARKGLPDELVARVNQALLRLDKRIPAQAEILSQAEAGGFQTARDRDYDAVRVLMGLRPPTDRSHSSEK